MATPAKPVPVPPKQPAVGPSLDSNAKDSLGNLKENVVPLGPRGADTPPDVMTDAKKQAIADKVEARLKAGMSSTAKTDSTGKLKGSFAVTLRGNDKNGARYPDAVDYSKPLEAPPVHVGPRGAGAPQDSFHGPRPAKKE